MEGEDRLRWLFVEEEREVVVLLGTFIDFFLYWNFSFIIFVQVLLAYPHGNLDGERSSSRREINKHKTKEGRERNIHVHQRYYHPYF